MDQNNNNNFMDSKTLIAIVLVGLVWFGWQQYINNKYGSNQTMAPTSSVVNNINMKGSEDTTTKEKSIEASVESNADSVRETFVSFENDLLKLEVSSKGMSLRNIELKRFQAREGGAIKFLGSQNGLFGNRMGSNTLDFEITKASENTFIGIAKKDAIIVTKKITFTPGYSFDVETHIESHSSSLPLIELSIEDQVKHVEKGSIFSPPTESQDVIVINHDEQKDFNMAGISDPVVSEIKQSYLMGVSSHYFSAAFYDQSEMLPNFSIHHAPTDKVVIGTFHYQPGLGQNQFTIKGKGFVGPKDVSVLEAVDPVFLKLIKFGFFSAIAKPLLITMKWINSFVGNWGLAIILLTLLVRMIVMPLHIMSFRSMKAMQKVQPLITSLREKYKDDPMALNREMMDLMKKHKVNPMGGCLPMLLQIPVFFAMYRVFSESIELYQSPFLFWIHDLSAKDPYFVLPLLMAVVMFLQQKMTPSTMDPAQAKVMQFMPLIFSFMMISLPSALTLYMFVSTFFGILQQYLFLRDKTSVLAVKQAN